MIGQRICSWDCMEARHVDCTGGGCVCRCHVNRETSDSETP